MIERLKKMFDFFYLRQGETKKEYKRRVGKRGYELLNGINCTLEESINFTALCICRASTLRIGKIVMSELTEEETKLKKGNAKDFEKYAFAVHFNHLDEKEFDESKKLLWDKARKSFDIDEFNRQEERYHPYLEEKMYHTLLEDDKLIKEYGDLNEEEQARKINRRRFPKK